MLKIMQGGIIMESDISRLNVKGMFCYGLKLIINLIDYFNYDYSK